MEKNHKPLSIRHERFCENVAGGMVPGKAYQKAGYKVAANVAKSAGGRLLTNVAIKAKVREIRARGEVKAERKRENLVHHLWTVLETPIGQITPESVLCQEWIEETIAGVSRGKNKRAATLRRKVKMTDKMAAARLLVDVMGWKEPETRIVETGPKTLESIAARAARVCSALDAWTNRRK